MPGNLLEIQELYKALEVPDAYDLYLMSDLPENGKPSPGKIYLQEHKENKEQFEYLILSSKNTEINGILDSSTILGEAIEIDLNARSLWALKKYKSKILEALISAKHINPVQPIAINREILNMFRSNRDASGDQVRATQRFGGTVSGGFGYSRTSVF